MKFFTLVVLACLYYRQFVLGQTTQKRLLCYYDTEIAAAKQATEHYFDKRFLKALSNCTHLMYSYAQILPQTFKIGKFRLSPSPRNLKIQFPHLKLFLSLGGDKPALTPQYLEFLKAEPLKQKLFSDSVITFLKSNYLDGLDLAIPFPRNKPRKVHSSMGMVVKSFKKFFTSNEIIDANASIHKRQYTRFVSELKNDFVKQKLQLSMTVLPNVNSSWYFDISEIYMNFEFINLFAFDFLTPTRNPNEADYTAPIYFKNEASRLPYYNADYQVNHWINNGCPVNKLNLGIATYGRAWKLTKNSGLSGQPVVESTDGPADKGKLTQTAGILSWSEICIKLTSKGLLRRVVDAGRKYGTYAFRPADRNGGNGIWISYDDPEFAATKTEYVKQRKMGGVALYALQYDDFQQFCMGSAFPILASVSQALGIGQRHSKYNVPYTYYQMYPQYAQRKNIIK